jgi:hypothetical protein
LTFGSHHHLMMSDRVMMKTDIRAVSWSLRR